MPNHVLLIIQTSDFGIPVVFIYFFFRPITDDYLLNVFCPFACTICYYVSKVFPENSVELVICVSKNHGTKHGFRNSNWRNGIYVIK